MIGSMLLKQMSNLGDETFVVRWIENPYWSRVLGMEKFTSNMTSHMIRVILCILGSALEKIKISEKENIKLRQRYTRIVKQLMIDQRFREHPKRQKKANAAARKLKTIADRLVRDV